MSQVVPVIVSRDAHTFSRKLVDDAALKVLYRLDKAGFESYLVGGCVRDILLGKTPKDFDVVTNAYPQQVRRLFSNSRIIGRRFKLVHVLFGGEVIEVSTFRGQSEDAPEPETDGDEPTMILQDNEYGTLEEDVWRRDFTINALYYNIANFSVVDYVGGLADLSAHVLRTIGEPDRRFREDPVRMLRAIRLAAKLDFTIEPEAEKALQRWREDLYNVSSSRLFDEFVKLFFTGHATATDRKLKEYHYWGVLFPAWEALQKTQGFAASERLVQQAMHNTDTRFAEGLSLNPGFLLAAIGWPMLQEECVQLTAQKKKKFEVLHHGVENTLKLLSQRLAVPKRFTEMMRTIWVMQYHLQERRKRRVFQMLEHRYYRAAIDFLELRASVGEPLGEVATWWRTFAASNRDVRQSMIDALK